MSINSVCKKYFDGFKDLRDFKTNSAKQNISAALRVISYLTIILPFGFGVTYKLNSLRGRATQQPVKTSSSTNALGTSQLKTKKTEDSTKILPEPQDQKTTASLEQAATPPDQQTPAPPQEEQQLPPSPSGGLNATSTLTPKVDSLENAEKKEGQFEAAATPETPPVTSIPPEAVAPTTQVETAPPTTNWDDYNFIIYKTSSIKGLTDNAGNTFGKVLSIVLEVDLSLSGLVLGSDENFDLVKDAVEKSIEGLRTKFGKNIGFTLNFVNVEQVFDLNDKGAGRFGLICTGLSQHENVIGFAKTPIGLIDSDTIEAFITNSRWKKLSMTESELNEVEKPLNKAIAQAHSELEEIKVGNLSKKAPKPIRMGDILS